MPTPTTMMLIPMLSYSVCIVHVHVRLLNRVFSAPIYGLAEQAAALIRQEWNVAAVQQVFFE